MPLEPPVTLQKFILKPEYQAFARTVNDHLRWNSLGYEAILYTLISFLFPPYAEYWMVPSLPPFLVSFLRFYSRFAVA
jgi:hypothetical protein